LSFLASQTLPPLNPSTKASPLSRSSRVLKMPSPYEPCIPTPQSLPGPAAWLSPFTGAGLSGLPDLNHSPASSDDSQVSDYFFISRSPEALRPQRSLSLPPTTTLLAEGWTAPRSPSKRSPIPGAAFRSPRTASPCGDFIPGSTFPACPFGSPSGLYPARSALWLHNRSRFAPVATASLPRTRCRLSTGQRQPYKKLPLPFGAFTPLGINASAISPASGPASRPRPIPDRSPLPSS
jgi:hypothetical protein